MRDRATFTSLRHSQRRGRSGPLSIAWIPGPGDEPARVAFVIGRRVGGAVVRNRVRRRLRAVMAELAPAPGAYLIGVDAKAATLSSHELKSLVSAALKAAGGSEEPRA